MPEFSQLPDIDPSVDQYLDETVSEMFENSIPSTVFGDEHYIEPPKVTRKLGESATEAHIRIQKENKELNKND